jgi:hypothetical protein
MRTLWTLLLAIALSAGDARAQAPVIIDRIVLEGGYRTSITPMPRGDYVAVSDSAGRPITDAACDATVGMYDDVVAHFREVRNAITASIVPNLARLTQFPLRVTRENGRTLTVLSADQLQSDWPSVAYGAVSTYVATAALSAVRCGAPGPTTIDQVLTSEMIDGRMRLTQIDQAAARRAIASAEARRLAPTARRRTISDGDRRITVEELPGLDHVTVTDVAGALVSESSCALPDGTYDHWAGLLRRVRTALLADDRERVEALTVFPLTVTMGPGRSMTIRTSAEFLARYGEVFTPAVMARVRAAVPSAVTCRRPFVMLGDNVLSMDVVLGRVRWVNQ